MLNLLIENFKSVLSTKSCSEIRVVSWRNKSRKNDCSTVCIDLSSYKSIGVFASLSLPVRSHLLLSRINIAIILSRYCTQIHFLQCVALCSEFKFRLHGQHMIDSVALSTSQFVCSYEWEKANVRSGILPCLHSSVDANTQLRWMVAHFPFHFARVCVCVYIVLARVYALFKICTNAYYKKIG